MKVVITDDNYFPMDWDYFAPNNFLSASAFSSLSK